MIGYVMVGTNNLKRAETFYAAIMPALGMSKNATYSSERYTWYSSSARAATMFVVTMPHDEKPATVGNGTMVALNASSREDVNKAHALALANGASDEGAPGLRGDTFYGAYFRDLDGNKLAVFTMSKT